MLAMDINIKPISMSRAKGGGLLGSQKQWEKAGGERGGISRSGPCTPWCWCPRGPCTGAGNWQTRARARARAKGPAA
jgi:hypothetical protein